MLRNQLSSWSFLRNAKRKLCSPCCRATWWPHPSGHTRVFQSARPLKVQKTDRFTGGGGEGEIGLYTKQNTTASRVCFSSPLEMSVNTILQSVMERLTLILEHFYCFSSVELGTVQLGKRQHHVIFQRGLWGNVGGPHSTLHVNRQNEAFSLRGLREWKGRESRETKWEGGVISDCLTLILSNDSLLVISYSRSNAVKWNRRGVRLDLYCFLHTVLCNTHNNTYTHIPCTLIKSTDLS